MTDKTTDETPGDAPDQAPDQAGEQPQLPKLKENLKAGSTWLRGFYLVLFAVFYGIAEFVLFAVVIFQFLTVLVTRQTNRRVVEFGHNIARYIYDVMLYLTFVTDERPFPFAPWPSGAVPADSAGPSADAAE